MVYAVCEKCDHRKDCPMHPVMTNVHDFYCRDYVSTEDKRQLDELRKTQWLKVELTKGWNNAL